MSIINHPTEGVLLWQYELEELKVRGVSRLGLVVSDGLSSIENATAKVFPTIKHQLCVVPIKRNILAIFPRIKRLEIAEELLQVFAIDIKDITPVKGFENLYKFVEKYKRVS
ncbi:transposase-like protein [Flavobacterium sp. 28A]|uniref:transposase n=1 Tax=Flavobacterium sp. 28A TaxID=2735895 RepID=UPI00157013A2|nr:transposase [Flavobacterium sp. 28A]NRT16982.1 transposase-like protein [Flavobacterium sp. 28A]